MNKHQRRSLPLFLLFAVGGPCGLVSAQYTVIPIGDLGGPSFGIGLNGQGQVVGASLLADGTEHAFFWQQGSGMVDIGQQVGGVSSTALAINNDGIVLINSQLSESADSNVFEWQFRGGVMNIGGTSGWSMYSRSITNNGQVAGGASTDAFTATSFGFLYSPSNGISQATVSGTPINEVELLNNVGQMVVRGPNYNGALFYALGSEPIEMKNAVFTAGAALAMNDQGTVVGFASPSDGDSSHAFSWSIATGLIDLTPGKRISSSANGINNLGQIVGTETVDGADVGFLYEDGVLTDLSGLLDASGSDWSLLNPEGINDNGQIVGSGWHDGEWEAFLLTPTESNSNVAVPEPASASLLLLGTALLIRRNRRVRDLSF